MTGPSEMKSPEWPFHLESRLSSLFLCQEKAHRSLFAFMCHSSLRGRSRIDLEIDERRGVVTTHRLLVSSAATPQDVRESLLNVSAPFTIDPPSPSSARNHRQHAHRESNATSSFRPSDCGQRSVHGQFFAELFYCWCKRGI